MSVARVLVVEDEDAIRALIVAALRREPFEVDAANDGVTALQFTAVHEYAVIVLDLMMPRLNGFEFLDAFRAASPQARSTVIVLTAFDETMLGKLTAGSVDAIIRKPFDVPQLVSMVREVAMVWAGNATDEQAVEAIAPPLDADVFPDEAPN
jgi:two-component system OmpR family response regulator